VARLALTGFLVRLVAAVAASAAIAVLLAALRDGASFTESMRISSWLVGCLLLLLAVAGHSPAARSGTIDPWLQSHFPKLVPLMSEEYSGTRVSSSALFVLAALAMFALGAILG
jgi:hypothetical protein